MRTDLSLFTSDGERIAVSHHRAGNPTLVVVSHGFFNSRGSRSLERVVRFLLPRHDVIVFDYRGHGQSSGAYTFGARERRDFEAVAEYAARYGYRRRALLGFSLGALTALCAERARDSFDSLMLVSCPWSFGRIDCHFWERPALVAVKDIFNADGKARRARIGNPFLSKPFPGACIPRVKAPVLFVHGQRDWLIKPWHSRALCRSKRGTGSLEILRGGFHGEKLTEQFPSAFSGLALDWFRATIS